ncbi:MAG TPA: zinc metalloprotease HtpX [Spirochaetota bacterium]|nr:zinc metalloprotease HtpX [Spirochaetota bacterium]
MVGLQMRLYLLLGVFFGIIYFIVFTLGNLIGFGNNIFYFGFSLVMILIQYLMGPKMVEWSMGVKYINEADDPVLYGMVKELAETARIPMPKVGISAQNIPNAFAFGRSLRDGRVCVTSAIRGLLNDNEMRAVLGHEISHLKNRDVLFVTLLSVIPNILYFISMSLMRSRNNRNGGALALVGVASLLLYFVSNLLVLYASRIREYFADRGAVALGNKPEYLASALYKLVYGSSRVGRDDLRRTEGMKAFFANDPSRAKKEFADLRQLDIDGSGTIDSDELANLSNQKVKVGLGDRIMEFMSTHPNMLKRIKALSEIR